MVIAISEAVATDGLTARDLSEVSAYWYDPNPLFEDADPGVDGH
jgi:hypothetical protein